MENGFFTYLDSGWLIFMGCRCLHLLGFPWPVGTRISQRGPSHGAGGGRHRRAIGSIGRCTGCRAVAGRRHVAGHRAGWVEEIPWWLRIIGIPQIHKSWHFFGGGKVCLTTILISIYSLGRRKWLQMCDDLGEFHEMIVKVLWHHLSLIDALLHVGEWYRSWFLSNILEIICMINDKVALLHHYFIRKVESVRVIHDAWMIAMLSKWWNQLFWTQCYPNDETNYFELYNYMF